MMPLVQTFVNWLAGFKGFLLPVGGVCLLISLAISMFFFAKNDTKKGAVTIVMGIIIMIIATAGWGAVQAMANSQGGWMTGKIK